MSDELHRLLDAWGRRASAEAGGSMGAAPAAGLLRAAQRQRFRQRAIAAGGVAVAIIAVLALAWSASSGRHTPRTPAPGAALEPPLRAIDRVLPGS